MTSNLFSQSSTEPSRGFHVDYEDREKRVWHFDVSIEGKALKSLSEGEELNLPDEAAGKKIVKSEGQREFDVIRSLAEQIYGAVDPSNEQSTYQIVVSKGNTTDACTFKIIGLEGQDAFDVVRTTATKGQRKSDISQVAQAGVEEQAEARLEDKESLSYNALRIVETSNQRTMIDLFKSASLPSGRGTSIGKILDDFFTYVGSHFKGVEKWWNRVVGKRTKMPWNMAVLAKICNIGSEAFIAPSLIQACRYIASLSKTADPRLSLSLEKGVNLTEKLTIFKEKVAKEKQAANKSKILNKALASLKKDFSRDLDALYGEQQLFLPMDDQNALITVSKQNDGTFTVNVYDPNRKLGLLNGSEARSFSRISLDEMNTIVEGVSKVCIEPDNQAFQGELINAFSRSSIVKKDIPEYEGLGGDNVLMVASLATKSFSQSGRVDCEYTDLAMKIRLFVDMCHASEDWLVDPTFHAEVQKQAHFLLSESNNFLSKTKFPNAHLEKEFSDVYKEVQRILMKTQHILPKIPQLTATSLAELGASRFPELSEPAVPEVTTIARSASSLESGSDPSAIPVSSLGNLQTVLQGDVARIHAAGAHPENFNPLPDALKKEMKKEIVYNLSGHPDHAMDADMMEAAKRQQLFPNLTGQGFTPDQEKALIYTLHSQKNQDSQILKELFSGASNQVEEAAKLARAHYTLQVMVNQPLLASQPVAQAWVLEQLFGPEKRIEEFFKTTVGRENLKAYLEQMLETGSRMKTETEQTSSLKGYKEALSLCRLAHQIKLYAEANHPEVAQEVVSKLKNPLDTVQQEVASLSRKSDQLSVKKQAILFPEWLGSIYDDLSGLDTLDKVKSNLTDVRLSVIFSAFKCLPDAQDIQDPALKAKFLALKSLIYKVAAQKINGSDSAFINNFLTHVGQTLVASYESRWQVDPRGFPILQGVDKQGATLKLDLTTAEVFSGDERVGKLPKYIASEPDIQRLFPNAEKRSWKIQKSENPLLQNVTVYGSATDPTFRVVVKEEDTVGSDGVSNPTRKALIEKSVVNQSGKDEWLIYTPFPSQDALESGENPTDKPEDLPINVARAIRGKYCFRSRDGNKLVILDRSKFQPYATFYKNRDGGPKLLLANGETLLDSSPQSTQLFSTIEAPDQLAIYGSNGRATKVEYPLLSMAGSGLTFSYDIKPDANGQDVAQPSLFPGWTLAPFGKRPTIDTSEDNIGMLPAALPAGFTGFQLLQKDNQQKILIPGRQLKIKKEIDVRGIKGSQIKGAYETEFEVPEDKRSSKLYEYSLDPETNRLVSTDPEANLQLAYISLVHKDYGAALFYAQKARTGAGELSGYSQVFQWIENWTDPTPNGIAAQLKLLCFADQIQRQSLIQAKQKYKKSAAPAEATTKIDYTDSIRSLEQAYHHHEKLIDPALHLKGSDRLTLQLLKLAASDVVPQRLSTAINDIETRMRAASKTPTEKPIQTVPGQNHAVIGEARFNQIKKLFSVQKAETFDPKTGKRDRLDLTFLDGLEKSKNPSVERLSKIHREDIQAAVNEQSRQEIATITPENAQKLLEEMETFQGQVEADKARFTRQALSALEGVDKGGASAVKRTLGLEESATMDSLIQLWLSGDFRDNKRENITKLAKRKVSEQELQVLDWTITEYMAAFTDLEQVKRVVQSAENYLKTCSKGNQGNPDLAQILYEAVSTKREYALYTSRSGLSLKDLAYVTFKNAEIQKILFAEMQRQMGEQYSGAKDLIEKALKKESDLYLYDELARIPKINDILGNLVKNEANLRQIYQAASDADFRELLSIEYALQIVLRPGQITTLRNMISDPNRVEQLGMGQGKSNVILPLIAKRKATGKNLVAILLPDALYATNRDTLDKTNRKMFGQTYSCFEYNRFSNLSAADFDQLYLDFLNTIESQGFIATNKSSLLSFKNSYISKISELEGITDVDVLKDAIGQVKSMAKILKLFEERMEVVADEVDEVLDVRKEVNFAQGNSEKIDPIQSDVALEFLTIIVNAKEGEPLNRLKKALQENTQALIPEVERMQLLQEVAGIYWEAHAAASPTVGVDSFALGAKDAFIAYVSGQQAEETQPAFMKTLKDSSKPGYKRVAALKSLFKKGFGVTLGKTGRVHYGRQDDSPANPFTIPFKASNTPSVGSEFNDPIERISYTLQDYLQKPIERDLVNSCIGKLSDEMQSQHRRNMKNYIETGSKGDKPKQKDTQAYKDFVNIVLQMDPGGKALSPNLLDYLDEVGVDQLVQLINSSPLAKIVFCKAYTLDQRMKIFPDQVSANAQDLVDMVHCFGGFTGTPWNSETFHDKINTQRSFGTDGLTYALLLKQNCPVKTIDYDPKDPAKSLIDTNYKIFIDSGALLQGVDNTDFMKRLIKAQPKSSDNVGIYFDEQSGKMMGRKADGSILPMEEVPTDKLQDRLVLYDQAHTVGSDIRLDRNAVAAVTISKDSSIRKTFQAVWRLRQLDRQQRVEFLMTKDMEKLLMGDQYGKKKPTIQDILRYCLEQEANLEADDNFRSEVAKISGYGTRSMFHQLVEQGAKLSTENREEGQKALVKLYTNYAPDLIKKRKDADTEAQQAAVVTKKNSPKEVLTQLKVNVTNHLIEIAQKLDDEPHATRMKETAGKLKGRSIKADNLMPKQVDVSSGDEGTEVEAQVEVQVHSIILAKAEEEEPVEEVVEQVIAEVAKAGGAVQVAGKPITHQALKSLSDASNTDSLSIAMKGEQPTKDKTFFRSLFNHVGAFDPNIFIGRTYEGALQPGKPSQATHNAYDKIDLREKNPNEATKFAKSVLHSARLPINEALFVKGKQGWKVVFSSTHDSYPSFSEFPGKNPEYPASLVAIGPGGPVSIAKNDSFKTLSDQDKKEFYKLYVQLKFLRGEVNYASPQEQEALKAWINKKGPREMCHLFEQVIRATKDPKDQIGYTNSTLHKLFKELNGPDVSTQIQIFGPGDTSYDLKGQPAEPL